MQHSRQRANQALQLLEREGLLKLEYGGVTILDMDGLRGFQEAKALRIVGCNKRTLLHPSNKLVRASFTSRKSAKSQPPTPTAPLFWSALPRALCFTRKVSAFISAWLNAGMSAGLRLLIRLPSCATSWSTQLPPALWISSCSEGRGWSWCGL